MGAALSAAPLSMQNPALEKLFSALVHKRLASYANFSSAALLICDYLLTLDEEITYVWPGHWNAGKILFMLTRYPPFISTAIILYHEIVPSMTLEACNIVYQINAWLYIFGILVADIILLIRAWIVWHKARWLSWSLPIYTAAFWAVIMYAMASFLRSLQFADIPGLDGPNCLVSQANLMLVADWAVLTGFEAGIIGLMIITGYRAYRMQGNTGLVRVVYRDGIIYYFFIFAFSIVNVAVILSLPDDLVLLFAGLERMIHSALTARLLLSLRRTLSRDVIFYGTLNGQNQDALFSRMDTIDFATHSDCHDEYDWSTTNRH